ncbi:MAG: 30S ribosomal protein S1 [Acidobacteriota bacterium]|nr:30S ribosomal protein S1 [Acidobacteriota bacterium]
MSDTNIPDPQTTSESNESFEDILSQYEKSHSRRAEDGSKQLEGTVVAVSAESIFLDIGYKSEGILPLTAFPGAGEVPKPGDKFPVSVKGRDPEGYYQLSRTKVSRPTDWSALEQAFAQKATIMGTVTSVVKGGLSVDVGVRAFLPASRSATRDAADLEKLVGQEIRCRITKLDVTDEDVVVDRRAVAEEEERVVKERRYSEMTEGETVRGTVRSLTDYGAFVDIGGVDGLLHVSDIAWGRISKPEDVLFVGQEIEARVLKIDAEKRRISLGLKQLQPDPWGSAAEKYRAGERICGTVTHVMDFGAFVELEPGLEGLIHVSEMSWAKKVRAASDFVKPGETVEAVVLGVAPAERRISLGLKQALGDPWADVAQRLAPGRVIDGVVTSLTKFGAFVQLSEGAEGMIHVSEISAEKRINHPQEVLQVGQSVRAQVIALDTERRLIRLSMKQLVPTSLEEYIAEHNHGDVVTGRVLDEAGDRARVELGEGILATCRIAAPSPAIAEPASPGKADLSSLSAMLQSRWKGSAGNAPSKPEAVHVGQIRSFRITNLDPAAKKIELELVS